MKNILITYYLTTEDFFDFKNVLKNSNIEFTDIGIVKNFRKKKYKTLQSEFEENSSLFQENDTLIINSFENLGKTTYKIMDNINFIFEKKMNILIFSRNLILNYEDEKVTSLIKIILDFEDKNYSAQKLKAKITREKNKSKIGRKPSNKSSSVFEKYKSFILKQKSSGIPNTKILTNLQNKDSIYKGKTVQALGSYINQTINKKSKKKLIEQFTKQKNSVPSKYQRNGLLNKNLNNYNRD